MEFITLHVKISYGTEDGTYSILYDLQGVYDTDGSVFVLTSSQLDIATKVINILTPI